MASFPELQDPLSDGVVTLRPSAERDIPEVLIAYQDDPALHQALGEPRPPSGAALGRRAKCAQEELLAGRTLTFTILQTGSDICRGEVRVAVGDWQPAPTRSPAHPPAPPPAHRRAQVRVWLAPGWRGRGMGRRAHTLACRWPKETCGPD